MYMQLRRRRHGKQLRRANNTGGEKETQVNDGVRVVLMYPMVISRSGRNGAKKGLMEGESEGTRLGREETAFVLNERPWLNYKGGRVDLRHVVRHAREAEWY